ncbi:MAG: hypothetical protein Q8N99_07720 [Nanoarchaeota archaeon]|nr:hypothetical protein [Nanoarchaeota archaeon]
MKDKIKEYFIEASRHLKIADHIIYITYPLVNEKRLLLKVLEELSKSIDYAIKAIVRFETKNKLESNEIFYLDYSKKYLNEEELKIVKQINELNNRHKDSAIEFPKKEKIIIMADNLDIHALDINTLKTYYMFIKNFILKTRNIILNNPL